MLRFSFRIFDENDNLKLTAIVPAEQVFDWIARYKDEGIVKAYIINDEEGDN